MSHKQQKPKQNQHQSSPRKKSQKKDSNLHSYARYGGMAIQMIVIIGVLTWAGVKLDERSGSDSQVYTIILSLLGVFAALYTALKDFIKK